MKAVGLRNDLDLMFARKAAPIAKNDDVEFAGRAAKPFKHEDEFAMNSLLRPARTPSKLDVLG